jgi:hypothetical protein
MCAFLSSFGGSKYQTRIKLFSLFGFFIIHKKCLITFKPLVNYINILHVQLTALAKYLVQGTLTKGKGPAQLTSLY